MTYDQHKREWMLVVAGLSFLLSLAMLVEAARAFLDYRVQDSGLLCAVAYLPWLLSAWLTGGVIGEIVAERALPRRRAKERP